MKKNCIIVHYIDYNKQNRNPNNLITLCNSCNAKVNFNRNYWKNFFGNYAESSLTEKVKIFNRQIK